MSLFWWFENSSVLPSLCWAGRQRRLHCCTSGSNFNKNAFNFSLFPSTLLCRKSWNLLCHSLSWNSFRKRSDPYRCRLISDNLCTYCQIINIFNVNRLCSIPIVTVSWYPRSFLVGGNCLWICSQKYLTTNPSPMWWRPLSWAFRARNNSFLLVVYMSHHPSNESREIRNAKVLWGLRNQLIYLKVWCGERRKRYLYHTSTYFRWKGCNRKPRRRWHKKFSFTFWLYNTTLSAMFHLFRLTQ